MGNITFKRATHDKENFYTMITSIDGVALRDRTLSWGARGLLAYLLSHTEGFDISKQFLYSAGPDGRTKTDGLLEELQEKGYLFISQERDENGRFGNVFYINEIPEFPNE